METVPLGPTHEVQGQQNSQVRWGSLRCAAREGPRQRRALKAPMGLVLGRVQAVGAMIPNTGALSSALGRPQTAGAAVSGWCWTGMPSRGWRAAPARTLRRTHACLLQRPTGHGLLNNFCSRSVKFEGAELTAEVEAFNLVAEVAAGHGCSLDAAAGALVRRPRPARCPDHVLIAAHDGFPAKPRQFFFNTSPGRRRRPNTATGRVQAALE